MAPAVHKTRMDVARHYVASLVDPQLQHIFDAAMADGVRCWELGVDGAWTRTGEHDYQAALMAAAVDHAG